MYRKSRARTGRIPTAVWVVFVLGLLVLPAAGLGPLPQAHAEGGRPLDKFFKGQVSIDEKTKEVTIKYDFRKKSQLADFQESVPWPIKARKDQCIKWFDGKLEVVGNAGARHIAEWDKEITVTVSVTPFAEKDIGGWLEPAGGGNDWATFTLTETFFHAWDNSKGGTDSIIKFGDQWRESGATKDFIGFRYGQRRTPKEKLQLGKSFEVSFGLRKKKLFFNTPGAEMADKDRGKKLKKMYFGFYAIKGQARFDNVVVTGVLSKDWMKEQGLELRVEEAGTESGFDEETQQLLDDHKNGKAKATRGLVKLVGDVDEKPELRVAAKEALMTGPKKAVRAVQDLLYSPHESVREDGRDIVKALLGKDFGFKPKGSQKGRDKAIQKLNEALDKNPELLEG